MNALVIIRSLKSCRLCGGIFNVYRMSLVSSLQMIQCKFFGCFFLQTTVAVLHFALPPPTRCAKYINGTNHFQCIYFNDYCVNNAQNNSFPNDWVTSVLLFFITLQLQINLSFWIWFIIYGFTMTNPKAFSSLNKIYVYT